MSDTPTETNKLEEIRQRLSAYEEAHKAYRSVEAEFWNPDQPPSMEARLIQQRYWNIRDGETAWGYLKILLPLAKASVEYVNAAQNELSAERRSYARKLENEIEKFKGA